MGKKIPIKTYRRIEELIDNDYTSFPDYFSVLDLNCVMTKMEKYCEYKSDVADEFHVRTWREWVSDEHEKYWMSRLELADVDG